MSTPSLTPSSPLSSCLPTPLSRSPSPGFQNPYTTPPSSQLSDKGANTPRTEEDSVTIGSSDRDGPPPKKRRKTDDSTTSKMPRPTKRLNLTNDSRDSTLESNVQLDRLMKALRKKRKIVVVAGAGISVSAGIPDFRSSTGLFKTLRETHNLKGSGKQLFDAGVYRDANSTSTFHSMVREMSAMSVATKPTAFHHLVARLAHEGRLLRLYTQNVDGLENKLDPLRTTVPLPSKAPFPKTVQLHGGLEKMICSKCSKTSNFDAELFDQDLPPECAECRALDHTRTELAGKRSHGIGRLRPRMTLYNETGPDDDAIGACSSSDIRTRPDCVLVVGTTLSVPGVRRIVREMCAIVRDRRDGLSVWVNLEQEPAGKDLESAWDLIVTGKADDLADRVALGRWDDPEIVEAVKDDEVRNVTVCGVAVPSPRKPDTFKDVLVDRTPNTFYDPVHDAVKINEAEAEAETGADVRENVDVKPTGSIKLANPATQGRKLDEVLGKETRTAAGENARKPKAKKAMTAVGAKAPAPKQTAAKRSRKTPAKKVATGESAPSHADIRLRFKSGKCATAVSTKDKPSSDAENVPCKGGKPPQRGPVKKRISKQLDEVPAVDERVNSPSNISSKNSIPSFPGLSSKP